MIAGHTTFDLESVGYEQSEYFLQGTAHSVRADRCTHASTGSGRSTPSSQAPYTTRVVVEPPIKPP